MKIILTGGHLAPALAILEQLPSSAEILFVGRKYTFEGDKNLSFEYQTAKKLKIPFKGIKTGRLQRTFTKYTILSLLKFPLGFFQALRIIKQFKPDVILSFGGYVSLPVVLSGVIFTIPIVIHEQAFKAGLANRIASFFAKKICISWKTTRKYFPSTKTVVTGNPIRKFNIGKTPFKITNEDIPTLFITGGSAGSHTINLIIMDCLEKLLRRFVIIHQTGDSWDFRDFDRLEQLKKNIKNLMLKKRYIITKFVNVSDVGKIFNTANLVISRAGINTVTELVYFGKPAILIPLNCEQAENALFFKNIGLGEVLDGKNITSNKLYDTVLNMVNNLDKYQKNKPMAKKLVRLDGAQRIISVINEITREKNTK